MMMASVSILGARTARADSDCQFTIDALPVTLSSPGTYCLSSDLGYGGLSPAVWIAASDVTLDLQGFTLAGTSGPASMTVGIFGAGDRTTVTNGTITGFRNGVSLLLGSGARVLTVRAVANWYSGLAVGAGGTVQGCEVLATGGSLDPNDTIPVGIRAAGDGVVVADTLVSDMVAPPGGEAVAIAIDEGFGARVERNVIANAAVLDQTWGIWSLGSGIEVRDNLIVRFAYGMAFTAPSSGLYAGNIFFDVPMPVALGVFDLINGGNSIAAAFCEPIYAIPYVISQQGSYCLVRNVRTALTTGAAILIAADMVKLDLRGFTVAGDDGGPGSQAIGIYAVGRRNVTVTNGNVRGFWKGVFLDDTSPDLTGAQAYRVERIQADDNINSGIHVRGRAAMVLRNHVMDTNGKDGADTYGIRVDGALARVRHNKVAGTSSGTAAYGVVVANGRGSVVEDNEVLGVDGALTAGIVLDGSNDALVLRNRILRASTGIQFSGSTGRYRDNVTSGVVTPYVGGSNAGNNN
jgi:hypothetical protein